MVPDNIEDTGNYFVAVKVSATARGVTVIVQKQLCRLEHPVLEWGNTSTVVSQCVLGDADITHAASLETHCVDGCGRHDKACGCQERSGQYTPTRLSATPSFCALLSQQLRQQLRWCVLHSAVGAGQTL